MKNIIKKEFGSKRNKYLMLSEKPTRRISLAEGIRFGKEISRLLEGKSKKISS